MPFTGRLNGSESLLPPPAVPALPPAWNWPPRRWADPGPLPGSDRARRWREQRLTARQIVRDLAGRP